MITTLSPEIEQAKSEGESSARWDFRHVGSDVTYSLMEQASGNSREIPSRRAMERASAEYFGPSMVAEVMERHASEGETVDTAASRAFALAYVQTYRALVWADFLNTRRERVTVAWRERHVYVSACRAKRGCVYTRGHEARSGLPCRAENGRPI